MKHKVKIAISNGGKKTQLLTGDSIKIPMRILHWLLGDFCEHLERQFKALKFKKFIRGLTFPANHERR